MLRDDEAGKEVLSRTTRWSLQDQRVTPAARANGFQNEDGFASGAATWRASWP